jgi:hypothetical protein
VRIWERATTAAVSSRCAREPKATASFGLLEEEVEEDDDNNIVFKAVISFNKSLISVAPSASTIRIKFPVECSTPN